MGQLLQDLVKPDLAEPFMRRDLEGCERVHGPDSPITLKGGALQHGPATARSEQARPRRALLSTYPRNLGNLPFQQGKLKEAEPFFRRALEGCERTLGSEQPHTRTSARWLTMLLDKIQKAIEHKPKKKVDYLSSTWLIIVTILYERQALLIPFNNDVLLSPRRSLPSSST